MGMNKCGINCKVKGVLLWDELLRTHHVISCQMLYFF